MSHIILPVINWAKHLHLPVMRNIIFLLLCQYTSHMLQPLDLGCFRQFQEVSNNEYHKFIRQNPSAMTTKALASSSLIWSSKRSCICTFNSSAVDSIQSAPTIPYKETATNEFDKPETNQEQQDTIPISDCHVSRLL